jgi:hypothetical protein
MNVSNAFMRVARSRSRSRSLVTLCPVRVPPAPALVCVARTVSLLRGFERRAVVDAERERAAVLLEVVLVGIFTLVTFGLEVASAAVLVTRHGASNGVETASSDDTPPSTDGTTKRGAYIDGVNLLQQQQRMKLYIWSEHTDRLLESRNGKL